VTAENLILHTEKAVTLMELLNFLIYPLFLFIVGSKELMRKKELLLKVVGTEVVKVAGMVVMMMLVEEAAELLTFVFHQLVAQHLRGIVLIQ